jgi:tubulin epsilon
MTTDKKGVGK